MVDVRHGPLHVAGRMVGMLMVVRHAHAGEKAGWGGPDVLRPLSPAGRRQAEGLVLRLEDFPVERILSSPTLRCHETVQPLARDRYLRIERAAALDQDASIDEVLALVEDPGLRSAVLCTHGETIGRLLTRLVADGMVLEEPLHWPKGSTWLLEREGRRVRARYLPPLELDRRTSPLEVAGSGNGWQAASGGLDEPGVG